MKPVPKLVFILLSVLCTFVARSQNNAPQPDDEFDLFLLVLLTVFVCGMIGAAIVGAMAAALVVFFLFALISLGLMSASVAIGLYRRSFSAGFKTFLYLLFGISCALIGAIGMLIVDGYFDLPGSSLLIGGIGAGSGLLGGLLLAAATTLVIKKGSGFILSKLATGSRNG